MKGVGKISGGILGGAAGALVGVSRGSIKVGNSGNRDVIDIKRILLTMSSILRRIEEVGRPGTAGGSSIPNTVPGVKGRKTQEELAEDIEDDKEDEDKKKTATPEELSAIRKEVTELKTIVAGLKTQLNKRTGAPAAAKTELKTEIKTETKLSREEVQKAAAEMRKKFKY